jgi:hypothetical protein
MSAANIKAGQRPADEFRDMFIMEEGAGGRGGLTT